MVIPLSLSASKVLSTHEYLNVPIPFAFDSTSYYLIVLSSIQPSLYIKCPAVVDLPAST
jgi:hypothetical protein